MARETHLYDSLLLNDVVGFFESAGVSHHCPFCEQEGWHMLTKPSGILSQNQESITEHADVKDGLIKLTCKNCGYIRFQDALIVFKWKKAQNNV